MKPSLRQRLQKAGKNITPEMIKEALMNPSTEKQDNTAYAVRKLAELNYELGYERGFNKELKRWVIIAYCILAIELLILILIV